jgi:hypothetical protein
MWAFYRCDLLIKRHSASLFCGSSLLLTSAYPRLAECIWVLRRSPF